MAVDEISDLIKILFNDTKEPIAVISRDHTIKLANNAAVKILGLSEKETIFTTLKEESIPDWTSFIEKVVNFGSATCEVKLMMKQGRYSILLATGCYQHSSDLLIIRFEFPNTIPKVLSNSKNFNPRFLRIFNSTLTGIILNDENGVIIDANDKAADLFGKDKGEIIGKSYDALFHAFPEEREVIAHFMRNLQKDGLSEMMVKFQVGDKEFKFLHFISYYYGENKVYLTLLKDETETENLRNQIQHNSALSILGQLAASIAHEIRNPMTSLKGFTELLRFTTSEEGQPYLTVIDKELNRMDSILNEFLILSKPMKRDKIEVSVKELILDVISIIKPQAIMQNIYIDFYHEEDEIHFVFADPNHLKQVLINLIKNAIEVSEPGKHITITLGSFDRQQMKISVEDQGPGLSEQKIDKIFQPFYTTKRTGTGLGLPYVLKTVEELGGTIHVSSKIGEGTTFDIILPSLQNNNANEIESLNGITT